MIRVAIRVVGLLVAVFLPEGFGLSGTMGVTYRFYWYSFLVVGLLLIMGYVGAGALARRFLSASSAVSP